MRYNVAVVGATGNVGREILQTLAERKFPVDKVYAVASKSSLGKTVSFGDDVELKVEALDEFDFSKVQIALFSPGSEVSKIYAPKAAEAGCVVIDNTSCFRMEKDVPLIVPEVNIEEIVHYKNRNIISNPNCCTIQRVVALKPLHDNFGIKRIVLSTYQSVSGAGKDAMSELYDHTKSMFSYQDFAVKNFPRRIAFNIIPQIDSFLANGYTKEEQKMVDETQKILDEKIEVTATCVRVPVFVGHSESINIEFEDEYNIEEVYKILKEAPGVKVLGSSKKQDYITPIECVREDDVFVSRIRRDHSLDNGLNMWIVSDNLRKGAALNAVQIAESLIKHL